MVLLDPITGQEFSWDPLNGRAHEGYHFVWKSRYRFFDEQEEGTVREFPPAGSIIDKCLREMGLDYSFSSTNKEEFLTQAKLRSQKLSEGGMAFLWRIFAVGSWSL